MIDGNASFILIIIFLLLFIGFILGFSVNNTLWMSSLKEEGRIEFYLDENIDKQWRWKE